MSRKPICKQCHSVAFALGMAVSCSLVAQAPLVSVRLSNPTYMTSTERYCVEAEFQCDTLDQEVFGMNIRFFYDDAIMEFDTITNYAGGYSPTTPDPPQILSAPVGESWFGFTGDADWVNGAMELSSLNDPIFMDTALWVRLFDLCFTLDNLDSLDTMFCPPIVWDLEQDPADLGYLTADDGVVITLHNGSGGSLPADEHVVQFNWEYVGTGEEPPYGQPLEDSCINLAAILPLRLLSFTGSPVETGVLLRWTTQDEWGMEGFTLERSFDREIWMPIHAQPAANTLTGINRYQYTDTDDLPARVYYRLVMHESVGPDARSHIVTILLEGGESDFLIFPNPSATGRLAIRLPTDPVIGEEVLVSDASGRLLLRIPATGREMQVQLPDWAPGIYMVTWHDGIKPVSRRLILPPRG